LASDLSSIIKSEIVSTLESLLSVSGSIEDCISIDSGEFSDGQCVKVETSFEFSGNNTAWNFYIPTETGAKFEYLMLGGISDLKDTIDDEITDAVKEIISTISGSITTSTNAQGFDDISGMKSNLGDSKVIQCSDDSSVANLYKFTVMLNDESLILFMSFDDTTLPFIELLSSNTTAPSSVSNDPIDLPAPAQNSVLANLLGDDSAENLRLLFDIKLRLSVRLGTKVCLLKDVISWDIGEIIELSQMISEPLDILVNGIVIGSGEAVIVDGKFGVKIKHLGEPKLI